MDPELLDLVKQKPGVLLQFLSATGVETFADLRGVWTSSTEFVTEVESFIQEKLEPDVAMQLATFWTLSSRRATEFQKRLTKNLVMERESAYRSPGLTLREAQSSSSAALPRVKRLIAEGSAGPPVTTVKLAASDAEVKETVAIQTKIDAIFQLALEEVVNLQDLGVTWTELEDPLVLQSTKDTMMANASRLSLGRLSALLAAFRRWRRYAAEHGLSVRSPTPMQLASFLRQVGQGGPTAASSQFLAMLWWQKALGADFPMDHWLVAPWRLHAANHQGSQATELAPWEFLNLLRWAAVLQGTHQLLVSFLLMIAVSCVRFEHIQRSKYIQRHDGWLEFFCRKGKARKQGSRPGFGWCLPDVRWQGFSLCAILADYFKNEALSEHFLIPSLDLQPEDLWEITSTTPLVLNKAMSRGRFLEILRGSLIQINVDPTSASRAQYNRLRRFLPTGGNMVQLEPFDQQALGNWTEIPSGAGASGQKARAQMHMGMHYAGDKLSRSYVVKSHVLKVFMQLFKRRQADFALDAQGLLVRGAWEWPEASAAFEAQKHDFAVVQAPEPGSPPPLDDGLLEEESEVQILSIVPAADEEKAGDADPEAVSEHLPVEAQSDGESVTTRVSSISASDVSAEGLDLDQVVTDESDIHDTKWFQQGSKLHIVREVDDDGHSIPWCRDHRFAQLPKSEGTGFSTLVHDRTCQRCLARMPRSLMAALSDFAGWKY